MSHHTIPYPTNPGKTKILYVTRINTDTTCIGSGSWVSDCVQGFFLASNSYTTSTVRKIPTNCTSNFWIGLSKKKKNSPSLNYNTSKLVHDLLQYVFVSSSRITTKLFLPHTHKKHHSLPTDTTNPFSSS